MGFGKQPVNAWQDHRTSQADYRGIAFGRLNMKISEVEFNNRRKVFIVHAQDAVYTFPYSKTEPEPTPGNYVQKVFVDEELGKEGFTYILVSGEEGSVHTDSVLEFTHDPDHMKEILLYNLTLALRRAIEESAISKRELIRQLNTSPSQYYRMLDPTNTAKSMNQMIKMFYTLDCDLEFVIKQRKNNTPQSITASTRGLMTV